jgi:hypothetical protein
MYLVLLPKLTQLLVNDLILIGLEDQHNNSIGIVENSWVFVDLQVKS